MRAAQSGHESSVAGRASTQAHLTRREASATIGPRKDWEPSLRIDAVLVEA